MWPWSQHHAPHAEPPKAPDDIKEAKEARRKSTTDYLATVDRNLEVRRVSEHLKEHRDDFAAAIEESMRRKKT
jgi:hypothetical protein